MNRKSFELSILLCVIIFALIACTGPTSATTITINNSSSIAGALLNVGADGTVILQPGTYFEHDIELTNSTTIRANSSAGGSAENTIIDAGMSGKIIETDTHSITIEGLTLRDGRGNNGGAIDSTGGDVIITSSVFANCSASSGGAIHIMGGTTTITSSTFTGCSATGDSTTGYGGAIYSSGADLLSVSDSVFDDCSSKSSSSKGGAIFLSGTDSEIADSTFTGCNAPYGGAIYIDTGTTTVTSSTFTGCEAASGGAIYAGDTTTVISSDFTDCDSISAGGAIYASDTTTVTSSTFTGCGASHGGAIHILSGTTDITSSTFESCVATLGGGIYIDTGTTNITSSAFTGCSVYNYDMSGTEPHGGAIHILSGNTNVTSSTFADCSANDWGLAGAIYIASGTTGVTLSDFTNCDSDSAGGAIYIENGNTNVTLSDFTDCDSISAGGAIYFYDGTSTVTLSDFTNCEAFDGGAIYIFRSTNIVTSSTFTGCKAFHGGAIDIFRGTNTVTSSTFAGCQANCGGAISIFEIGSGSMHLSRIYNCSVLGKAVYSEGVVDNFDATNNWWGTNTDPSAFIGETTAGSVTYNPWLILGASASPAAINPGGNSIIRADLRYNSDGEDTSGNGYVPDGIPVTFGLAAGPGSLSPLSGVTGSGVSATTYSSSSAGTATINTIVDDQTVNCTVLVNSGGGGSGGGSRSGGGSNSNTGVGSSQNLKAGDTASFDFEGKGSVDGLLVTVGDDTAKLMVTVKSRNSLPSSIDAPDTEVYEYEDVTIYYAEPSDISGGTFEFKVEKSWLSSNGFEIGDIVMMHYNEEAGVWEELSTTFVREEGGYYYYSAQTPSFSWFAIAFSEGATIVPESTAAPVTKAVTAAGTSSSSSPGTPVSTKGDTGVPAASGDQGSWISLAIPVLLVVLVIIVAAGFGVRKKRQEYPDWWDKEFK
jgi:PGF-pre-PGF domain-containing protein